MYRVACVEEGNVPNSPLPTCGYDSFESTVFVDLGIYANIPINRQIRLQKYWEKTVPGILAYFKEDALAWFKEEQPLIGPHEPGDFVGTYPGYPVGDGDLAFPLDIFGEYTEGDFGDALELACIAENPQMDQAQDCEFWADALDANGVNDLQRAKARLDCRARQVHSAASAFALADAPATMVAQFRAAGTANIYPTFGGAMAQSANDLHIALQQLSGYMIDVSEQTRSAGLGLELVQSQLAELQYAKQANIESAAKELAALNDQCTMATTAAAYSAAASQLDAMSWGSAVLSFGTANTANTVRAIGAIVGAQQQCGAGRTQAAHAKTLKHLANAQVDEKQKQVLIVAADAMLKQQANVEKSWKAILIAYGDAQAAIAAIESHKLSAQRAAAKLLMLDNDAVGNEFPVNTAMRARMNTLRVRYESARDYAIRMAYLARRSIEQKIGMDLSTLEQDVGWVPAPRSWADKICTLSGIDYDAIRDADNQTDGAKNDEGYHYADQYVGDYVRQLREFMTAYVNRYVSHDGDDFAVISLRDEILGLRDRSCDVRGPNKLLQTYLATEGLPLGMSAADAKNIEVPTVWERTCDAQGYRTALPFPDSNEHPLVPYGLNADGYALPATLADDDGTALPGAEPIAPTDFPRFGQLGNVVKPVRLIVERSPECGGGADDVTTAPDSPPTVGMAYWYRADSCSLDPSAPCADRSGNTGRDSYPGAAGSAMVTKVNAGIGGLPTLSFPKDSYIYTARNLPVVPFYTLVSVFRVDGVGTKYVWQAAHTASEGRPQQTVVSLNTSWWGLGANEDTRASVPAGGTVGPYVNVAVGGKITPQDRLNEGDILVIRNGPQGVDVYVNGTLRAHADQQAAPSNLHGYVGYATGGPIEVAETLAYHRSLLDSEVEDLHRYLSARYTRSLNPPANWFNADAVQELRSVGHSQISGYRFSGELARDSATGLPIVVQHGPLDTRPLEPFPTAADKRGLRLHNEHFTFNILANVTGGANNSNWSSFDSAAQSEYTASAVVKLDGGGGPAHTILAMQNPLHSATDTRHLYLEADCGTGTVGFLNTRLGSSRVSANNTIDCATPFVVSLRGSKSAGTTDIFVNGVRVLSDLSFDKSMYHYLGGRNGRYMRGLVADMQFHVHKMPDSDITALHAELAAEYEITSAPDPIGSGSTAGNGILTAAPEYRQLVRLADADYLLSWYERAPASGSATTSDLVPSVRDLSGNEIEVRPSYEPGEDRWLGPGWTRHFARFSAAGDVYVGWEVPPSVDALAEGVLFAGPQLERDDNAQNMSIGPSQFWPTDDDAFSPFGVCEDRDGSQFRPRWVHGCETYCPANIPDCADVATDPSKLPTRCFMELSFALSQDELERTRSLQQAGFAEGNFNYRWEQVAVNLVGTAVKNCELSELTSACYANNSLQYSLRHDGPFTVRNYFGRDYQSPLFPGRIQQSRALLAERYLTNPMSSADRNLLGDFWDHEFVGRPLDGSYKLRIYEQDALDWDAIEDVQLLMHYRYWTRLN